MFGRNDSICISLAYTILSQLYVWPNSSAYYTIFKLNFQINEDGDASLHYWIGAFANEVHVVFFIANSKLLQIQMKMGLAADL